MLFELELKIVISLIIDIDYYTSMQGLFEGDASNKIFFILRLKNRNL